MSEPRADDRRHVPRVVGWGFGVGTLGLGALLASATTKKFFALDEFQYAHAAWAVSRGQVPYRDFFDHHFPLLYEAAAPLVALLGDSPHTLVVLRAVVVVAWLIAFVGVTVTSAGRGWRTIDVSAVLLVVVASPVLWARGLEWRPDSVGAALYLGSIAALMAPMSRRRRAVIGAILLAAAVWTTQKVLVYGLPFVVLWTLDVARTLRGRGAELRTVTAAPWRFAVVGVGALGLAIGSLVARGSFDDFLRWCIEWSLEHERTWPGFPWTHAFVPMLPSLVLTAPLAIAGVVGWWRRAGGSAGDPHWLLILSLPSTFASFAFQRAPYAYSLLPFLAFWTLAVGQGLAALATRRDARWRATLAIYAVVLAAWAAIGYGHLIRDDNAYQLSVLDRLRQITEPSDPVYDQSGAAVWRPHVGFYYYTNRYLRHHMTADDVVRVIDEIDAAGCTVYLHGSRFETLPAALRHELVSRFVPAYDDLWIWGRRLSAADDGSVEVEVPRAGHYFLGRRDGGEVPRVERDGAWTDAPIFLERGVHRLRLEAIGGEVFLLWLPADGQRFVPGHPAPSRFSRV